MTAKNFANLFTVSGIIVIMSMFLTIVDFINHQDINNNNTHIISAFSG